MLEKIYIGVDLGTSSVKVLAMHGDGKIIGEHSSSYEVLIPKPGYSEQGPEDWYNKTLESLRHLMTKIDKNNIVALSFSGQMHGLVVLDKEDNVIRPAILWNDHRTVEETNYINEELTKEKVIGFTGNIALTGFTLPKLLWLRNNEKSNYEKIEKIMLPKDYLAYKFTNEFVTDYSDASGTLLLDVKNKKWSEEMLSFFDIDIDKLPRLANSTDIIGDLNEEVKEYLGVNHNINVIIGGGDQAVAAIGAAVVDTEMASISLGTSGVVFVNNKNYSFDTKGRLHSFVNANGDNHFMGVTLSAAQSLKWWIETVLKADDYANIVNKVISTDKNSVVYLPYLNGERTPHNDPNAKGVLFGLSVDSTDVQISKSIMEGVAFSIKDILEIVLESTNINDLIINGGGTRNEVWCQIFSDVLQRDIVVMNTQEGPAFGAAIIAAVGTGRYESLKDAVNNVSYITKTYKPDAQMSEYYAAKYSVYNSLYINNVKLFRNLKSLG